MPARKRIKNLYELVMDFLKNAVMIMWEHSGRCLPFILLSIFPFMIFLLTLTRYIPFSKDDIIVILTRMISFEEGSLIKSIVNEIYRKTELQYLRFLSLRHCGLLRVEFILSLLDWIRCTILTRIEIILRYVYLVWCIHYYLHLW